MFAAAQTMAARPFLAGRSVRATTAAARPARASVAVRAERPMWCGRSPALACAASTAAGANTKLRSYPGAKAPAHLDGSMAGDYGFDPLRIGANEDLIGYYREAELMNGRWAMAAVAGILFTDAFGLGNWWEAGTKEYALPFSTLAAVEIAVMAVFEAKRIEGWKKTGECGVLGMMPFDPMGMKSPEKSTKELKNGRLAMMAFLGFCSQAAVTGMGPIECLKAHIEDPWHNNIYTSSVGVEVSAAIVAACCWPTVVETYKSLSDDEEEFRPIPW